MMFEKLSAASRPVIYVLTLSSLFLVSFIDYASGGDVSFSLFYLFPIFISTWFCGKLHGFFIAVISALLWGGIEHMTGQRYLNIGVLIWNSFIRFSFFIIITILLGEVNKMYSLEKKKAIRDSLTGISNTRGLYEVLEHEISRSKRYGRPLSVAYIDLDNFKTINDTFGHIEGDRLLRIVAGELTDNIRMTDFCARLGGDEFVILFSETEEDSSDMAIRKVRESLLARMKENKWPVTFSIGVVDFKVCPETPAEIIKLSDDLMYEVKKNGKNNIKRIVFTGY